MSKAKIKANNQKYVIKNWKKNFLLVLVLVDSVCIKLTKIQNIQSVFEKDLNKVVVFF